MIIIVEIDRHWAGIGIDWMQYIKGFRLGFFAIHFISSTLDVLVKAYREEPTERRVSSCGKTTLLD